MRIHNVGLSYIKPNICPDREHVGIKETNYADNLMLPNYYYTPTFKSKNKDELCDAEREIIEDTFRKYNISVSPKRVNKENIDFVLKLIYLHEYSSFDLNSIINDLNSGNLQFGEKVFLSNAEYDSKFKDTVRDIFKFINKDNDEMAEKICKKYSKPTAYRTVPLINKSNNKFIKNLFSDGSMDETTFGKVIEDVYRNNSSLDGFADICYLKYVKGEDFPINYAQDLKIPQEYTNIFKNIYNKDTNFVEKSGILQIMENISSENIEVADFIANKSNLLYTLNSADRNFDEILGSINSINKNFALEILKDEKIREDLKVSIISSSSDCDEPSINILERAYKKSGISPYLLNTMAYTPNLSSGAKKYVSELDIKTLNKKIDRQAEIVHNNLDNYLMSEESFEIALKTIIGGENRLEMYILADIYDKETFEVLFHKKSRDLAAIMSGVAKFKYENLELLKNAVSCKTPEGTPLSSRQKIDLYSIVKQIDEKNYFNRRNIKTSGVFLQRENEDNVSTLLKNMVKEGVVDIHELNLEILKRHLEAAGLSREEINQIPQEKLLTWNMDYIHRISDRDINNSNNYIANLIRIANAKEDFKVAIFDKTKPFGLKNRNTVNIFRAYGLNYAKWLNPSPHLNVHLAVIDSANMGIKSIAAQVSDDIETLRKTEAKSFIDKQYPEFVHDGKFVIPSYISGNRERLNKFTVGLITQLKRVWTHSEKSYNNPNSSSDKKNMALRILTIKNHLEQRVRDIEVFSESREKIPKELTIKMWDRCPQKDLFQGNYSTCCIGMGEINQSAMVNYLVNTTFNMIEIVDSNSGETIGNALCYFVRNNSNEPEFVIDNIEIKNSCKPSEKVGLILREALVKYAKNVTGDVSGRNDIRINIGVSYNDLPLYDIPAREAFLYPIGDITNEYLYLDVYEGWNGSNEIGRKPIDTYQIR